MSELGELDPEIRDMILFPLLRPEAE